VESGVVHHYDTEVSIKDFEVLLITGDQDGLSNTELTGGRESKLVEVRANQLIPVAHRTGAAVSGSKNRERSSQQECEGDVTSLGRSHQSTGMLKHALVYRIFSRLFEERNIGR
jgi:hypothetical protein